MSSRRTTDASAETHREAPALYGSGLFVIRQGVQIHGIGHPRRGRELDHHGKLVTLDVQRHGCLNWCMEKRGTRLAELVIGLSVTAVVASLSVLIEAMRLVLMFLVFGLVAVQ